MTIAKRLISLDDCSSFFEGEEHKFLLTKFNNQVSEKILKGVDELIFMDSSCKDLKLCLEHIPDDLCLPVLLWAKCTKLTDLADLCDAGADRLIVDVSPNMGFRKPADLDYLSAEIGFEQLTLAVHIRRIVSKDSFSWSLCDETGQDLQIDALKFCFDLIREGIQELILFSWFGSQIGPHLSHLIERLSVHSAIQIMSIGIENEVGDLVAPLMMGADAVISQKLIHGQTEQAFTLKTTLASYGVTLRTK